MPKPSIVFFGSESWGVPVLRQLVSDGHKVALVVTRADAPAGRGKKLTSTPIKVAADELGLATAQPFKLSEILPQLEKLQPQLGVVVAFGKIIPKSVLGNFPLGILNLHPSLLPAWRGPSPLEATVLNNSPIGYSIIRLDEGMDSGDIFYTIDLSNRLGDGLSAPELYRQIGEIAAPEVSHGVSETLAGTAKFIPQDHAKMTICPPVSKTDGVIDWTKSATQIEREIRAYLGWPGSRTTLLDRDIIITNAHVGAALGENELGQQCGDGNYLVIDRLKPAGKGEMAAADFLRGLPKAK